MNEVRQILTAHAGQTLVDEQNVLHITLAGALDSTLDAPQRFNDLPVAERVRIARQALAQAGAVNVREAPESMNLVEGPPAPGRAMDTAVRSASPGQLTAEDRAFVRGLLKRMRSRKRRPESDHRDTQVAADATAGMERDCKRTLDYGYAGTDQGSKLPRSARVMDQVASARPLGCDGRPMSDLQYYRNAAAACSGGRS